MDRNSLRYLGTIAVLLALAHQEIVQTNQTSTGDLVFTKIVGNSNSSSPSSDDGSPFVGNISIVGDDDQDRNSTDLDQTDEIFIIGPPVDTVIHIFVETTRPPGTVIKYHPVDTGPQNYTLITQIDMCGAFCNGTELVSRSPICLGITCRQCYCDSRCVKYGDCCPDADGTLPEMDLDVEFSCVKMPDADTAYYMVNSCPANSTRSDALKSEILRPVTSLRTNTTYMNYFYALCNHETIFITWASIMICGEAENTTDVGGNTTDEGGNNCHTSFTGSPFDVAHRNCTINPIADTESVIDRCNVSGDAASYDPVLEKLCRSPEYRIEKKHRVFRNALCYLCNLEARTTACSSRYVPINPKDNVVISDLTDMSQSELPVECKVNQWRYPVSGICIDVHCMNGRVLEGYNCSIVDDVAMANVQYSFKLQFVLGPGNETYTWTEVVGIVRSNIPHILSQFEPVLYEFEVSFLSAYYTNLAVDETRDRFEVGLHVLLRSMTNMSRYVYEDYVLSRIRGEWKFTYDGVDLAVQLETYNETLFDTASKEFTYDPVNKTCCSDIYYMAWEKILSTTQNDFHNQPEKYITLSSAFTCAYLEFKDFQKLENGSVMILQNNVTLQKDDYLLIPGWFNDYIRVCLSKLMSVIDKTVDLRMIYAKRNTERYERTVLVYLTYTCVCLSLISIFLTFITFLKFPTLRSLPSKNTMFLALSIFAAQALFQFGGGATGNRVVCRMIGIFIHFLWLSVVFWMNVCCYHMFQVFAQASKAKMTSPNHWKILIKYSLYVYGMSSLVVGSSIAANYIKSEGMTIGYGDRKICYINDPLVIALAFVLPLGISIVANAILFTVAVYTISKISKVEKASSSDRGHLMMYIKLSTMTGGFWLLAILAEVTNVFALHIVSQILNGGQGVFIFLSYVTNRRVYKLWATAFGKKDLKYQSSMSSARTQSSKF